MTHTSTANFTLSGVIGGMGGLTKAGNGTGSLILSGANNYSGTTLINAGNVLYNVDGAIPAASPVTVGDGVAPNALLTIGVDMSPASAFAATVNSDGTITQNNNQIFRLTSLTGSGLVNIATGGGDDNFLEILGSTSTTYSGVLAGGATNAGTNPATNNRFLKTGTSRLTLTNANTFVSRTFISNGIINVQNATALGVAGANSALNIQSGGTLEIEGGINLVKTTRINGTGFAAGGAIHNVTGSNTLSGPLTIGWSGGTEVAADATIQADASSSLAVSSVIGGANALTKIGGGTLSFTGNVANTYTGNTLVNGGTLSLNKTGVNAIVGTTISIGGGTLFLAQSNQIIDTATVTITSGLFNLNGNSETINRTIVNGGSITPSGGTLTLTSNSIVTPPLTMRNTTVSSPGTIVLSGSGPVVFDATNNGTATIASALNLGGGAVSFDTANGTATTDMSISGVISNGAVTKITGGTLEFSGINTYTGTTTVNGGALSLNTTGGNAIAGNTVLINGGTLALAQSNQIVDTATVTLSTGAFNLAGNAETINRLIFNGGTMTGGTLTLASNSAITPPLTMRNTTLPGTVVLSGSGPVVFDPTNNGTATISANLNLGGGTVSFDVANGTALTDMSVSGVISNGALTKISAGTLEFSGANTYTGTTTITTGVLNLNTTGADAIVSSTVLVNGGTLSLLQANQIGSTTTVTLNTGATFTLNGNADTIGSFTFNGGTFTQGGATLGLASGVTALTMRNTSIAGNLNLTGSGAVVFDPTNNGTAMISGNVDLGGGTVNFDIPDGAASPDMSVSGILSNGGVTKSSGGTLELSGANNYIGTTTVSAGILNLNTTGNDAIVSSSVLVNGGTLALLQANQISSSTTVTLNTGGTFALNGNADTIGSFIFNGGTFTQGVATLGLASGVTALTMRNTTITGNLNLTGSGAVVFDPTNNGTATISGNVDLGGGTVNFTIPDGAASPDMLVSGILSNGGVNKDSDGTLEFSGANTYLGITTVNAGTLNLNTTGSNSILGNIFIEGGILSLSQADQIVNTSNVTLDSGTFQMNGNADTIGSFTFNGGSFTQGGATLTLASAITALTMRDTTISGNLALTGGGSIVFDPTNDGTASISGNSDLGGATVPFNIGDGSAVVDMMISGMITNGGMTKQGNGTLELTGVNTLANASVVEAGILTVNNTLGGAGSLTVNGGATLQGVGPINKSVTINGILSPGNSIATMTIVGNVLQNSGSTLAIEVTDSANDLVDITGTYTIAPNATLLLDITPGNYLPTFTRVIVNTTGGVTGTFTTVSTNLPLFEGAVTYNPTQVLLQIMSMSPSTVFNFTGNAGAVAKCIGMFEGTTNTDLQLVINQLSLLETEEEIREALLQMQPSQFTSLALIQESNTLYVRNLLFQHLEQDFIFSCCCDLEKCTTLWVGGFYGWTNQRTKGDEPGYKGKSPGLFGGIDFEFCEKGLIGIGAGYNKTTFDWKEERGKGSIRTEYYALYGSWGGCGPFIQWAVMGEYNKYKENRTIEFPGLSREARSRHKGFELNGHLGVGGPVGVGPLLITPFVAVNYLYLYEQGYKESGADSLDLRIKKKKSDLLLGEGKLTLSLCSANDEYEWSPFIEGGIAYEKRFMGRKVRADFNGCPLTVKGFYPTRLLVTYGGGFNYQNFCNGFEFNLFYQGKSGGGFLDHSAYAEIGKSF